MDMSPNTHDAARRGNARRRIKTKNGASAAGRGNGEIGVTRKSVDREDWLFLATSDPSSWLKDEGF